MRPQLFRAAARSLRAPNVIPRTFATTVPRTAEVELTIGMSNLGHPHYRLVTDKMALQMARRYQSKVNITTRHSIGLLLTPFYTAGSALIQACEQAGATVPR